MADRNPVTRTARSEATGARRDRSRAGAAWTAVAFGFLVVGLVAGTIVFAWKREWAWLIPVASFVGYLLAFRRGMILWNPAVDRTWRQYLWLEREMPADDDPISRGAEDPDKTLEIVRPEAPRPQRHELRVVR